MDNNLRLFLVASLCFVGLLLWQAWQRDYSPGNATTVPEKTVDDAVATGDAPVPVPDPASPATTMPTMAVPDAVTVSVRTDVFDVVIDTQGGDLARVALRDYPVAIDKPQEPFVFLDRSDALTFIAQGGLISDAASPTHKARFQADKATYELGPTEDELRVPLRWRSPDGLEVTRNYVFRRGSHLVGIEFTVDNKGAAAWNGRYYAQLQRQFEGGKTDVVYTYTGAAVSSPEKRYEKLPFDEMQDQPLNRDIAEGWAAILQHYFVAAIVPGTAASHHYYTKVIDGDRHIIGLYGTPTTVEPGTSAVITHRFYFGPKIQDTLAEIAPGLDLTVDYGALWFIAKPLFWLMQHIHGMTGNWGWSIVLLTLLVKVLFYRLAAASYRSMAKMRKVQPRLLALRERYGSDRARMNQAMMDLYREEKINPLGGCLPILIQIPVFLALYWVLLESVELRQADFIFWIRDLATKDPYFVLPLAMGVTMVLQQRLSPTPMDPVQQKVMQIMPIIFTVFFAFFPAGLVLYWFVNNLLSIGQQWLITRSIEEAKPARA
jgi:YidC/Oxa1 family membrane protein insertase